MKNWRAKATLTLNLLALALLVVAVGGGIGSPPPFKTDRLRVLVVEETALRGTYTSDQRAVITSTDAKSVKAAVEGRKGEFVVIDQDTADNLDNAAPWLREAVAVKRDGVPWVVAATPVSGFSEPLVAEAELLKRIEGLR